MGKTLGLPFLLTALLLPGSLVAREPDFREFGAVQESLSRVHPRMRTRWLYEHGVDARDMFTPKAPDSNGLRLVGKWGRGPSWEVTGRDSLVFLSLGSEIAIISFADPDSPRVVSEVQASGLAVQAAVRDSFLYIGVKTGAAGLEVWNIQSPASPVFRGRVLTRLADFCLKDTLALVTQRSYPSRDTFKVYDLSDPAAPRLAGVWPDSGTSVAVAGSTVILGDENDIHAIDITNPEHPQRVGSYAGWAISVAARNTVCCVTFGNPGQPGDLTFRVLDIANPGAMFPVGTLGGTGGQDLHLTDSLVFVSGYSSGGNEFKILSIRDSAHPRLLGTASTPGWGEGVWADWAARRAYVADNWEGLRPIDVSNPSNPVPDSEVLGADKALDIHVDLSRAYVSNDMAGLCIVDVADPTRPMTLGRYDTTGQLPFTNAVVARDSFAFVGWELPRFRTVSVADPGSPVGAGGCVIFNPPQDMVLRDSFVYVAEGVRFQVVNVARPRSPVLVGNCNTTDGTKFGLVLKDTFAYIASQLTQVINIARPDSPRVVTIIHRSSGDLSIVDSLLISAPGPAIWHSLANPAVPVPIDSIDMGHWITAMTAVNRTIYACSGPSYTTLYAISIADLHQPRIIAQTTLPYGARRIVYAEPYLYIACWDAGVCIYESTQVGIAEEPAGRLKEPGFEVGPSPTQGKVWVQTGARTATGVSVWNVSGRVVLTRPLDRTTTGPLSLDLSHLSPGVYFVREEGTGDRGNRGPRVAKVVLAR